MTVRHRHFALPPDADELVDAALARARQLSGSVSPSHLLTVICQDFLATNQFGKPGPDLVVRFIAKYEQVLQVRLVVIDADDNPIYGMDHLEALAAKLGIEPTP